MVQHQINTSTRYNRFPDIFTFVSKLMPEPKDILCFGCSTGEECFTLKEMYFPNANIYGVDTNQRVLDLAKQNNTHESITFSNTIDTVPMVDIVFAMSVFCRWPDTHQLEYNDIYKFDVFENEVAILDAKLKNVGVFVVYNSNYYFSDTQTAKKYAGMDAFFREEEVRKFNRDGYYSSFRGPNVFYKAGA